jgi:hypothetical protein
MLDDGIESLHFLCVESKAEVQPQPLIAFVGVDVSSE